MRIECPVVRGSWFVMRIRARARAPAARDRAASDGFHPLDRECGRMQGGAGFARRMVASLHAQPPGLDIARPSRIRTAAALPKTEAAAALQSDRSPQPGHRAKAVPQPPSRNLSEYYLCAQNALDVR